MPVESAADRAALLADFGDAVTWTRGASTSAFTAIFERPTVTIAGDNADLLDRQASLKCRTADLPSGAIENDPVSIVTQAGETFSLKCRALKPDGSGFTVVELGKA